VRKDPEPVRSWTWPHYSLVRYMLMPGLARLAGGWRVVGRENIPRQGGALIAGNHTSFLDPPLVGSALPRRTYYFAKRELFEIPLFGWLIRKCYAFPVDREGDDKTAFRHAIGLLRAGELLVVFPEGGRSPDGTMQEGGRGAALIAARAGVPLIPCALSGADQVLPRGAHCLHRGFLQVSFGPPILARGEGQANKSGLQEITDRVMGEIARMREEQQEYLAQRKRG
jgi:1-acyl-sn-glycerol-3-phosphate acyltransferase